MVFNICHFHKHFSNQMPDNNIWLENSQLKMVKLLNTYCISGKFSQSEAISSDDSTVYFFLISDSPGIPPSATAHELFRGFSFVAPALLDDNHEAPNPLDNQISLAKVSSLILELQTSQ